MLKQRRRRPQTTTWPRLLRRRLPRQRLPAPAAARRGRPADQDVLAAPVRCPGKAPKLDDLMARLLKAALIEFLLGLPAHLREADVLARGKTYFAGGGLYLRRSRSSCGMRWTT